MTAGGQGGYWVVSTEAHDSPTRVELVATFEQARTRFQALDAAQVLCVEVFGSDGDVLLHQRMDRWQMNVPPLPGWYAWNEGAARYQPLGVH